MMIYGYIYRITCIVTGKRYNGQSINPKKRIEGTRGHFDTAIRLSSNSHPKLYRSLRKHGIKNHKWKIIDNAKSKKELNKKEIYWIAKDDSFHNGLNCTLGGDGCSSGKDHPHFGKFGKNHPASGKRSKETLERIRLANVNREPCRVPIELNKLRGKFKMTREKELSRIKKLKIEQKKLLTKLKWLKKEEQLKLQRLEKYFETRLKLRQQRLERAQKKAQENLHRRT